MTVPRTASVQRRSAETRVAVEIDLDGSGIAHANTGIGFLDHLLGTLARHARIDLTATCEGDLHVDDHHTSEDVALAIGQALNDALSDRRGIARFGYAYAPLDESLARAVIDISGRPHADVHIGLTRDALGALSTENVTHVLRSLAIAGRFTLHVDLLKGDNDHHRAESAFKALALALRQAIARCEFDDIPSTKGVL